MSAKSYQQLIQKKPWYVSWRNARRRCIDPNNNRWSRYGGRGIKFLLTKEECEFIWNRDNAISIEFPQLDRIDVDGNYCLENCQFISRMDNIIKRDEQASVEEPVAERTD